MSVDISPVESTPVQPPKPPQLEIHTYPAGVEISSGARQFFFPYKTIQFLQLEQRMEAGQQQWVLHIRTDRDKINLTSQRDLTTDFKSLMISYRNI